MCKVSCFVAGQENWVHMHGGSFVTNAATLHGPQAKPNKRTINWPN